MLSPSQDQDLTDFFALSPVSGGELTSKISAATPKRTPGRHLHASGQLPKSESKKQFAYPTLTTPRRESIPVFMQLKQPSSGSGEYADSSFLLPGGQIEMEGSYIFSPQNFSPVSSSTRSPLNINTNMGSILSPITPQPADPLFLTRQPVRSHHLSIPNHSPFVGVIGADRPTASPISFPTPSSPFEIYADSSKSSQAQRPPIKRAKKTKRNDSTTEMGFHETSGAQNENDIMASAIASPTPALPTSLSTLSSTSSGSSLKSNLNSPRSAMVKSNSAASKLSTMDSQQEQTVQKNVLRKVFLTVRRETLALNNQNK